MKSVDGFDLWVFRAPVAPIHREPYEAAFRFWLETWKQANAEMSKPTDLAADAFTRQSEIIALFKDGKPAALICLRETDFDADSTLHDSLFLHPGMWRDEDKEFVRGLGGLGMIGSQITVHPNFRKTEGPISMKFLIVLLALVRAQDVGAETVVSAIRGQKGLDRVFGEAGAVQIAPQRKYGSTYVDLIAFQPQIRPINVHKDYVEAIRSLWAKARFSEPLTFTPQTLKRKSA